MNRTIPVSTDVFAAIWSHRQEGEETEDAILRRILECQPAPDTATQANPQTTDISEGFIDRRTTSPSRPASRSSGPTSASSSALWPRTACGAAPIQARPMTR